MIETAVERLIFMSRWLMAPIYLGLIVVLGVLVVTFLEELIHFVPHVFELRETDVILMTLSLLDVSLAASLVLMMIFAGYENFVAKIDTGDSDRPAWMGTLDFGGLKLKLISSIVAISGIDLLKSFMNIGQISKEDFMWKVITHLVFVLSGRAAGADGFHHRACQEDRQGLSPAASVQVRRARREPAQLLPAVEREQLPGHGRAGDDEHQRRRDLLRRRSRAAAALRGTAPRRPPGSCPVPPASAPGRSR